MLDTETFDTFSNPWDLFELHRNEDIDNLRNQFPVTQLHFIATDGYTNHMRDTVDRMDDAILVSLNLKCSSNLLILFFICSLNLFVASQKWMPTPTPIYAFEIII